MLTASFFVLFLSAGIRFFIGVMVKPLIADFGWSRGDLSLAVFVNMAVYAVAVVVAGRLYDIFGPRWVVLGSSLLLSLGYAAMAAMQNLWHFVLIYGVVIGLAFGGTTPPIFGAIVSSWFESRRGLAISVAMAGSCLGQFALVPVFTALMQMVGWRQTAFWMACSALAVNTPLILLCLSTADPRRTSRKSEDVRPVQCPSPVTHDLNLLQAMRRSSLWLFSAAMFVCGSADFFTTTHLVAMATDEGIPETTGAAMLAWFGLLSLGGILAAGMLSDRVGDKIPIVGTFALRVGLFVLLLVSKQEWAFWLFSLGFGFTMLVTAPLTTTLCARLYGLRHIGAISGFVTTVHHVGGGLWAYAGGAVYDISGSYQLVLLASAVLSGVAVICTILINKPTEGGRLCPETDSP